MFEPIAIVGQGCVLPGSMSPKQLWQHVLDGDVCLSRANLQQWRVPGLQCVDCEPDRAGIDSPCNDMGGYVVGFHHVMDRNVFSLEPGLVQQLDPLFLWCLEAAHQALTAEGTVKIADSERAGLVLGNLSYPTSLFSQYCEAAYLEEMLPSWSPSRQIHPYNRFMSGLPAILTAQAVGFKGQAFSIDAACASGLYAAKLACDSLQNRETDLMLAGGVNASDQLFLHTGFTALRALSPSGQSRPFNRQADGLVPAEGAAFIALKRLDDAIERGDPILGVIRGIGLSNDGKSNGFLSPSEDDMFRCMQNAFNNAGLEPADVTYIECHATGTATGDGAEISALLRLFAEQQDLVLGSLKANIGHTITASGVAGIVKTLSAFRHGLLPPTPNARPELPLLDEVDLRVLDAPEIWAETSRARLACINSFGFGGNNAQMIIEQWQPSAAKAGRSRSLHQEAKGIHKVAVVALAARTDEAADTETFARSLLEGNGKRGDPSLLNEVNLPAGRYPYPPKDLQLTLGQQLVVMDLVEEALGKVGTLDSEATGVFVGMGTSCEVARYGLRWRVAHMVENDKDRAVAERLQGAAAPPLQAAGVLGTMPNIVANRINNLYDFKGQGFTVSCEELSGDVALNVAAKAVARGEINAAIVGAVDLCRDPAHEMAARTAGFLAEGAPVDAAVVMVLRPLADAESVGDSVLAILDPFEQEAETDQRSVHEPDLPKTAGSHAAAGLLRVAAGLIYQTHRCLPQDGDGSARPHVGERPFHVRVKNSCALMDKQSEITLYEGPSARRQLSLLNPRIETYAAEHAEALATAIEQGRPGTEGPCRMAFVSDGVLPIDTIQGCVKGLRSGTLTPGWQGRNVVFYPAPVGGKIGFVYPGASAAYPRMAQDLLFAFPHLCNRFRSERWLEEVADWIYGTEDQLHGFPFRQLCASSFVSQIHTEFSRQVLGITPNAALGVSSGETNSLFALGIWDDIAGLFREIAESGMYDHALAGDYASVRTHWQEAADYRVQWESWHVNAPVARLCELVDREDRVYLTTVLSDGESVISGDAQACLRILETIGKNMAVHVPHDIAVHAPVVLPYEKAWRALHARTTKQPSGLTVYSNFFGGAYTVTRENVTKALTGQALTTVDFREVVESAWNDGVRVFVEQGPRDSLSRAVSETLRERKHVAVSLDCAGMSSLLQVHCSAAQLWAAGLPVAIENLGGKTVRNEAKPMLRVPTHRPPLGLLEEVLEPPPSLRPILDRLGTVGTNPLAAAPRVEYSGALAEIAAAHAEFVKNMGQAQRTYLELLWKFQKRSLVLGDGHVPTSHERRPSPTLNRGQLGIHAAGKVSSIFGPRFKEIDDYAIRVRMPEPPLLLCDRVIKITGELGSMGTGSVITETDIHQQSWFIHHGAVCPGLVIEAGQADLLLISWLGVDFLTKGERAYRLLGCDLQFHGNLPGPGDRLRYEIHVDGHASQGSVRLFFFHYDCYVGDRKLLSMRNGHAGFFTEEELRDAQGLQWDPAKAAYKNGGSVEIPSWHCRKGTFSKADVEQYTAGDVAGVFGSDFHGTLCHTRTPRGPADMLNLIGSIRAFDVAGGPSARGYLESHRKITPDDWFFRGHFTNDPCMPGTLMADAAIQLLSFYMTALGYTVTRDGWRFEPVPDNEYRFLCRGQVTPESKDMTFRLYVDEIADGPCPEIYAHVLCTCDGKNVFLCERLGVRLVPDWPLTSQPPASDPESARAAVLDGMRLDYATMQHCALGRPTRAFGAAVAHYDGPMRCPRLPGPPYHFMSRITELTAERGQARRGARIVSEYDIPDDAWYFQDNPSGAMPYCVLMEIGLQPCGWLASFILDERTSRKELLFRNLDGKAVEHRQVVQEDKRIVTEVTLLSSAPSKDSTIVDFEVTCRIGDQAVLTMTTDFGFFSPEALESQAGMRVDEDARRLFLSPKNLDLALGPDLSGDDAPAWLSSVPTGRLRMLDRLVAIQSADGDKHSGYIRAERDVRPDDWYFKAHFYRDPVQPGSLGIEAFLQLLQCYMLHTGLVDTLENPVFQPVGLGSEAEWHYRGQVSTEVQLVRFDAAIRNAGVDGEGTFVDAECRLWLGETCIYHMPQVKMRATERAGETTFNVPWAISVQEEPWILDHRPTYTLPALPFMVELDLMARALPKGSRIAAMERAHALGWAILRGDELSGMTRLSMTADTVSAELHLVSEGEQKRANVASAQFRLATKSDGPAWIPPPPLEAAEQAPSPYETGALFHGSAFQLMKSLMMGTNGARAEIDLDVNGVPFGVLNPGLLDAALHCIPHDCMEAWCKECPPGMAAYPVSVSNMVFHDEIPERGIVTVDARFDTLEQGRYPRINVWLTRDDKPLISFSLKEILLPKGHLGMVPPPKRRVFLQRRRYVAGVSLSTLGPDCTTLHHEDVTKSNWLPGTIEAVYGCKESLPMLARDVARADHAAAEIQIHPCRVRFTEEGRCENLPLNPYMVSVSEEAGLVKATSDGVGWLDWAAVRDNIDQTFAARPNPAYDMGLAMLRQFVARLVIEDPDDFWALHCEPVIYLANHETAVESLLFMIMASALSGLGIRALAKKEHATTWVGRLHGLAQAAMKEKNPLGLLLLDRSDASQLPRILEEFSTGDFGRASLLVHAPGTRAMLGAQPVTTVSSVFTDLSVQHGIRIVPVRFARGLPMSDNAVRRDFPDGFGKQVHYIGPSIDPSGLQPLTLTQRREFVMESLNRLGPDAESSQPAWQDERFAQRVTTTERETGLAGPECVVLEALRDFPGKCGRTEELIERERLEPGELFNAPE